MGFKKFIKDLFLNPDGSGSTKRTAGWILLFLGVFTGICGIFFSNIGDNSAFNTVFVTFFTSSLSAFGFSSYDSKNYYNSLKQRDMM